MPVDPLTPVIIGVGQITHRPPTSPGAPLDVSTDATALMAEAVTLAAVDAGLSGPNSLGDIGSIRVVATLSNRYGNPARIVADHLGLAPRHTGVTPMGGNGPQMLVNLTAAQIAAGRLDMALLCGGESWRTRMRARAAGIDVHWPTSDEPVERFGDELQMSSATEAERGLVMPIQVYPMFESALRAESGRTPDEHLVMISELWSRFSDVAASHPNAWVGRAHSAEEIRSASPTNRLIGLPYTKLMNSNNDVDMGAALIVCSAERAASLGVDRDRWVFPIAGTDSHEHPFISQRWSFTQTPAVELAGKMALDLAGTSIDEIDLIDLYSCFPSAVQLGARSLGLGLDRQLTRTGGLTFFGGPWNNYPMHAIATVVGELRQRQAGKALVWANGGFVTKHSFGVYATEPPRHGFHSDSPQDAVDALPQRRTATAEEASGPATVEAYTVMHDRSSTPESVFAACLLADGRRAWATSTDPTTAAEWSTGEWVGRPVTLSPTGTLT